ncbi:hypothetical protein DL764_009224 [Monosporascus ibericus]|uniref:Methyltransferase type 11 domain-containing protein n=1 Tax=Monosporascus ibericus TaxID=155417 RepID=A0A4V1X916_9PEZI|nr:hypothetical protein DL764_009224 [Monosporascus ibericus]
MSDSSLPVRTLAVLRGLLDPWLFLWQSAKRLPGTVPALLRADPGLRGALQLLSSPGRLRDAWFGRFWAAAGPGVQQGAEPLVLALLEGRVTGGRVVDTLLSPAVGGTVLEIGAGSGFWVHVFSDRYRRHRRQQQKPSDSGEGSRRNEDENENVITRVYGVEPNRAQHASLRRRVEAAGLADVYRIAPVGIEDLGDAEKWGRYDQGEGAGGIEKGSVDCIVSILCLCSIPDPERNIRELYGYLREGGRWYVYEHVRCDYGWHMRAYQRFLNLFWPVFIGGCQLCRPTVEWLREAGPWSHIDVGQPPHEEWYHAIPHQLGVFTK